MHLRSVNIEGLGCFFLSAQSKGETPNPGGGSGDDDEASDSTVYWESKVAHYNRVIIRMGLRPHSFL